MKQILQSYSTGEVWLAEVPAPAPHDEGVVVRTLASAVSAGTERMVTELAKKSLLGKALARPDLVQKVLQKIKTEGLAQAWQKVNAKMEAPMALGYSCAGVVVETGRQAAGFRPGDRVACAGTGYATHGEFNFVPRNLCAKIPENVSFEDASFTTLGAIALQAVRQADVRLGERVVVIGLGLLGLLAVQLLKASGCRVLGADPDASRCALAQELGADRAVPPDQLVAAATAFTDGPGADAVIVAAATPSDEPIGQAAEIARMKGRVVVLGQVGMAVPRDPFYRKELDLRLSMSYGPGRYDRDYEEHGRDYPFAYVRWTEQRNMAAFLDLVAAGKVAPSRLVTHRFPLDEALKAYKILEEGAPGGYLGMVITYPQPGERTPSRQIRLSPLAASAKVAVGLIGAGSFAKGVLLPALKKMEDVDLVGICTTQGVGAAESGRRFGFSYAATDAAKILGDENINAVIIATRHDTHARLVCDALRAGKQVFVEKPLAVTPEELWQIEEVLQPTLGGSRTMFLMVGFNRRFSAHAARAAAAFTPRSSPLVISYRVNAGALPADSWVRDAQESGGRIVGEMCHFADLCEFLAGSPTVRVFAESARTPSAGGPPEESVVVTLRHGDGSVSTIQYVVSGATGLAKERIEICCEKKTAVIEDFVRTTFLGVRQAPVKGRQDKGFEAELEAFMSTVRDGGAPPIPVDSLLRTTRVTFAVIESLRTGNAVPV